MTFDYGSETPPHEFVSPPSLLSSVRLRSGQVKLFNFRAKLSDLWQIADAIPAAPSKAACRLPSSLRPTNEIRSKFGRAHQTGDHGKWRRCFPTRRCADHASSRKGRPAPVLVVQLPRFGARLFGRACIVEWNRSSARLYTKIRDTRPFAARNHRRSYLCAANQRSGSEPLY